MMQKSPIVKGRLIDLKVYGSSGICSQIKLGDFHGTWNI